MTIIYNTGKFIIEVIVRKKKRNSIVNKEINNKGEVHHNSYI